MFSYSSGALKGDYKGSQGQTYSSSIIICGLQHYTVRTITLQTEQWISRNGPTVNDDKNDGHKYQREYYNQYTSPGFVHPFKI